MAKLNYDVRINGADNGIIVNVGCKTLVFKNTETDDFLADLKALLSGEENTLRQKYYPEDMAPKTLDGIGNTRAVYANDCGAAECEPQCMPGR